MKAAASQSASTSKRSSGRLPRWGEAPAQEGATAVSVTSPRSSQSGCTANTEHVRAELVGRLWECREQIERAILSHIREHFDAPILTEDAVCARGLRRAAGAMVEYGISGVEQGETEGIRVPGIALAQARGAVRAQIDLATILRCYIAGYALFEGFMGHTAEDLGLTGQQFSFCWPHQRQVELMDRLVLEIAGAYEAELARTEHSTELQRLAPLRRLLAGETVDSVELGCDLDCWHLAVIAIGSGSQRALRAVQARLGISTLVVCAEPQVVWAWFSSHRQVKHGDLERVLYEVLPTDTFLAAGEPGRGVDGWRLSHRQAQAAMRVVLHRPSLLTRYADVMLLATALQDEVLARSLTDVYLVPLGKPDSNQGTSARTTLRVYFKAGESAALAARELKISPKTVMRHLHSIEQLLGRALSACRAEVKVALILEELHSSD